MDVLSPLTQDEVTVLQILADPRAPFLAAIGRWKAALLNLERRGFVERTDDTAFNFRVTPAGRGAIEASEKENDRKLAGVLYQFRGIE